MLTARAECLGWVFVCGERHAERLLHEFIRHYDQERSHDAIDLEQPVPYPGVQQFESGKGVERVDRLGRAAPEYRLAA